jgi:hypothetical protein
MKHRQMTCVFAQRSEIWSANSENYPHGLTNRIFSKTPKKKKIKPKLQKKRERTRAYVTLSKYLIPLKFLT